jgi:hypothetical protein
MATISECRYRWLRLPATTFVITHSPSRSNRQDGFSFFWGIRDRATVQVRLRAASPGSSRVKGGRLLSTEHPEKLLSRALSAKEWGLRIYVEEKSSFDIFTTNLRSGVRISSGAPFRYKAGCAKPAVLGLKRRRLTRHRIRRSRPDLPILQRLQQPCRPQHCARHICADGLLSRPNPSSRASALSLTGDRMRVTLICGATGEDQFLRPDGG